MNGEGAPEADFVPMEAQCPGCGEMLRQLIVEQLGAGDYYLVGEEAFCKQCETRVEALDE